MYWTDVGNKSIYRAFINGTGVTELVTTGLGVPSELTLSFQRMFSLLQYISDQLCTYAGGLAWDWVNQKLYWTDGFNHAIEVFDPHTEQRTVLISTERCSIPRGLEVDPVTRLELSLFKTYVLWLLIKNK